jgi:hypothetical protein
MRRLSNFPGLQWSKSKMNATAFALGERPRRVLAYDVSGQSRDARVGTALVAEQCQAASGGAISPLSPAQKNTSVSKT